MEILSVIIDGLFDRGRIMEIYCQAPKLPMLIPVVGFWNYSQMLPLFNYLRFLKSCYRLFTVLHEFENVFVESHLYRKEDTNMVSFSIKCPSFWKF